MKPPPERLWAAAADEVVTALDTDPVVGLSAGEARSRLEVFGPNELIRNPPRSLIRILVAQFRSLIMLLLAVAAVTAFVFGETIEGWAVVVVILLNTAIGFVSELRATRSMEALFELGVVSTHVIRDGAVTEVSAVDLVPGDVVVVSEGDVIAADLRIASSSRLQADESALTGESLPVGKSPNPVEAEAPIAERKSMLFKGTAATRGNAKAVVVATGLATELGKITELVASAKFEHTPLEIRLDRLGRRLIWVTLAIAAAVVLTGLLRGRGLIMVQTALALAVAAIPEGLPVVATLALARGLWRMARRNALVNKLSSVETLGATSVICSDKTGTLTENRMTLTRVEVLSGSDSSAKRVLELGALCNNAVLDDERPVGDPMEIAILRRAEQEGISRDALLRTMPEVREEAFDPEVRMMATLHETQNGTLVAVKGAPEAVLAASALEDSEEPMLTVHRLAASGLRVIAVAEKFADSRDEDPYQSLSFVGLLGFEDPPRAGVRKALDVCKQAGVRVVMVTGDAPETARSVAESVGLTAQSPTEHIEAIPGSEIRPLDKLNVEERERLLNANLLVRVSPTQKLDLIALHQSAGHVVAMTGDGVNDAPALKKADIGIAMGQRGTEVAREAADMVLRDDDFGTIAVAIEQGREIFENIRKFVRYLLSCNISEVMVVAVAILAGTTLPVLPLQILLLNLVTDVFPALALGLGEGTKGLMERPPRPSREPLVTASNWRGIAGFGVIITVSVLGALVFAQQYLGLDSEESVTISFLTLAVAQLLHVFNMRDANSSLLSNEVVQNRYVWAAIGLCLLILLTVVYVPALAAILEVHPPGAAGWLVVLVASLLPLIVGQASLHVRRLRERPSAA